MDIAILPTGGAYDSGRRHLTQRPGQLTIKIVAESGLLLLTDDTPVGIDKWWLPRPPHSRQTRGYATNSMPLRVSTMSRLDDRETTPRHSSLPTLRPASRAAKFDRSRKLSSKASGTIRYVR